VHTRAVSSLGEEARVDFSFRTLEMGDRMWVAVDLEGEFWSQRLQEGAYYWVQFAGPYLVHSVPFDASGKLKQEEIEKLGQPASHG